jgi:hypothetical protein
MAKRTTRLFSIIAPGFGPYAAQFWADNEQGARKQYARFLGLSRCPNGTKAWEA